MSKGIGFTGNQTRDLWIATPVLKPSNHRDYWMASIPMKPFLMLVYLYFFNNHVLKAYLKQNKIIYHVLTIFTFVNILHTYGNGIKKGKVALHPDNCTKSYKLKVILKEKQVTLWLKYKKVKGKMRKRKRIQEREIQKTKLTYSGCRDSRAEVCLSSDISLMSFRRVPLCMMSSNFSLIYACKKKTSYLVSNVWMKFAIHTLEHKTTSKTRKISIFLNLC